MKARIRGKRLIRELLKDPAGFCSRGDNYKLVRACFDGFPVENFRPLLAHSAPAVRRAIVWPASELGKKARPLIDDAIALVHDNDRYIRFYALDVIAVCSLGEDAGKYVHVVRSLADSDGAVREEVMFLMSNAHLPELEAALRSVGSGGSSDALHKQGLSQLVTRDMEPMGIQSLIEAVHPLLRKYGAIAAWRSRDMFPGLAAQVESSNDPDIRKFWEQRSKVA